jgi:uridylate kinase
MSIRKKIVLKLTGELFGSAHDESDRGVLRSVIMQIKQLSASYQFSLITGGGNFFRGTVQAEKLGISTQVSHYAGMLATMMNGLILQDICRQFTLKTALFCALDAPEIGLPISPAAIAHAEQEADCLIFTGGTGNPFFTTDTNAVLRALQVQGQALWKGTKVDGVYTQDPKKHPHAQLLKQLSYKTALDQRLEIMDFCAFALAAEHKIPIRIFNIFIPNALIKASTEPNFGTVINDL